MNDTSPTESDSPENTTTDSEVCSGILASADHPFPWKAAFIILFSFAILCYCTVSEVYSYKNWSTIATETTGDDLSHSYLQWWMQKSLSSNPSELWHAKNFTPEPYMTASSDAVLFYAFITLPLYWMGFSAKFIYLFSIWLCLTFTAWFVWLCIQRLTTDIYAGIPAGVVLALCGANMMNIPRLHTLAPVAWGLIILLCVRQYQKPTMAKAVYLAIALLVSCYNGWYATLLTLFVMVFWGISVLIYFKKIELKRWFLSYLLTGLITGIGLIPYVLPYAKANSGSVPFTDLQSITRFWPHDVINPPMLQFGSGITRMMGISTNYVSGLYIGILPLLAFLACFVYCLYSPKLRSRVVSLFKTPLPLFCILVTLFAFILGAGPVLNLFGRTDAMPLQYLFWIAPPFQGLRYLSRLTLPIAFSLALSLGILLAMIRIHCNKPRAIAVICVVIACFITADLFPKTRYFGDRYIQSTPALEAMKEGPESLVLEFPINENVGRYESDTLYRGTLHQQPLYSGYTRPNLVSEFVDVHALLKRFPGNIATAAAEQQSIDTILLLKEHEDYTPDLLTASAYWEVDVQDELYAVLRRNSRPFDLSRLPLGPSQIEPQVVTIPGSQLLESSHLNSVVRIEGTESTILTGIDPSVGFTVAALNPKYFTHVELTMRITDSRAKAESCQLYWMTSDGSPISEFDSIELPFPRNGDEWQTITFDMTNNPAWRWRPEITYLRFDITRNSKNTVEIKELKFY